MTDLKAHLKAKTENYRQLSLDLKKARDNLQTKKLVSKQAGEKLTTAESEFKNQQFPQPARTIDAQVRELEKRGKKLTVDELDTIRTQAKNSHEAFNQATAEVKKLESSLVLVSPGLSIARKEFAIDEATNFLNKSLSQAGLLDTLQQSLLLIRAGSNPDIMKDELRKLFFNTFFDALLINDTIPTYADSLKAIDELLN
jgi:hypothetical protein